MDVRATSRFAERFRVDPRSRCRAFPTRPLRGLGTGGTALSARQPDHGNDVADPDRLAHRAGRTGDGPLARHRGSLAHSPANTDGLGCRTHSAAHREMCQRHRGTGHELRARFRLRPQHGQMGVLGQRLQRGDRPRRHRSWFAPGIAADDQPSDRSGGTRSPRANPTQGRRQRIRRAVLVNEPSAADLCRRRRADVADQRSMAAVDQHRPISRPSVAGLLATKRADT